MGRSGVVCFNILMLSFLVWSHALRAISWDLSKEEDMELERQLQILNKPYIKSFKDNYGSIYDCVDIYKQPAFDHPLLKNHTIQMKPSSVMRNKANKPPKKDTIYNFGFKKACPTGTVLIRRTRKEDLIRAKTFAQHLQPHLQYDRKFPIHFTGNHHAVIDIYSGSDTKYYGASAAFDVHQLPNVSVNQLTGGQVIVQKGQSGPTYYVNAIHFGWHIYYEAEHDNAPHFFTFWTTDGYRLSKCYNTLCPGYVQVSDGTTPGITIPEGEYEFSVTKDPSTGNWLLHFVDNENELIGYWPREIFSNMADISKVEVGGVVYSPNNEPSPPLGSGVIPNLYYSTAAKFKRVMLMNGHGDLFPPPSNKVSIFVDLPSVFYDVNATGDHGGTEGYSFQYGGPGGWRL